MCYISWLFYSFLIYSKYSHSLYHFFSFLFQNHLSNNKYSQQSQSPMNVSLLLNFSSCCREYVPFEKRFVISFPSSTNTERRKRLRHPWQATATNFPGSPAWRPNTRPTLSALFMVSDRQSPGTIDNCFKNSITVVSVS